MIHLYFLLTHFAAGCAPTSKFGIPTWYKYINGRTVRGECVLLGNFDLNKLDRLPAIGLGLVEILLFFAGIVAIGAITYGGFRYVLSQGEPENTTIAKNTVLNAVIGLLIAISATVIVRFLGRKLTV